jgi:hypothetical protein
MQKKILFDLVMALVEHSFFQMWDLDQIININGEISVTECCNNMHGVMDVGKSLVRPILTFSTRPLTKMEAVWGWSISR